MYKALVYFTDLQDNGHVYCEGDTFPRKGLEVSQQRLKELSTRANLRKEPVIIEVAEEVTTTEEPVKLKKKRRSKFDDN